jgi:hypothetical protein
MFNLNDYETVEERLKRAHGMHDDLRIVTYNHTTPEDRSSKTWVVEARIYLNAGDQSMDLAKATGWAFEIDGIGMANKTSGLENCETSAIGRALANMSLSGNKRASREEMEKVQRAEKPSKNWQAEIERINSVDSARQLFNEARSHNAPKEIQDHIKNVGQTFADAERAK